MKAVEHIAVIGEGIEETSPCLQARRLSGYRAPRRVDEPMIAGHEASEARNIPAVDRIIKG